jgi:hypothetical protein
MMSHSTREFTHPASACGRLPHNWRISPSSAPAHVGTRFCAPAGTMSHRKTKLIGLLRGVHSWVCLPHGTLTVGEHHVRPTEVPLGMLPRPTTIETGYLCCSQNYFEHVFPVPLVDFQVFPLARSFELLAARLAAICLNLRRHRSQPGKTYACSCRTTATNHLHPANPRGPLAGEKMVSGNGNTHPALSTAIRRESSPWWRGHASFAPSKKLSTAAAGNC